MYRLLWSIIIRSPGGTPVRSRPKSPLPGDPASIIAAALKKRFANMNYTPEKDNHDESNEFSSSPENTPQINRKIRSEVPKCKLVEEEPPKKNLFQLLKKSPRIPKPKPKEEEKPSLPIVSCLSWVLLASLQPLLMLLLQTCAYILVHMSCEM